MGCPRRRRTGLSPTFEPCQVRTAGGKWAHALCLTLAHDQLIPPRGTGDPLPVCRPVDFERMAKRRRADRIGDYSEIAILAASRAQSRGDLGETPGASRGRCNICEDTGGIAVPCTYQDCPAHVHPCCAFNMARATSDPDCFPLLPTRNPDDSPAAPAPYCKLHARRRPTASSES